jgi:hypothetical protein
MDIDGLRQEGAVCDDDIGLCQGGKNIVEQRAIFTPRECGIDEFM